MRVLLINGSPHSAASHGYRLAQEMIGTLREQHAGLSVIERDLALDPPPPVDREYATAITTRGLVDMTAFAWSERLIVELETSDRLIIATPMHNFTVPATLKLWIDYVLRIHRSFASTPDGKVGLMRDRPTVVIVGSGGFHAGERALQPDFLTPYLRYALGCVGIDDVTFVLLQGLAHGDDAVAHAVAGARRELALLAR